jgi:hypothetical protein
MIQVTFRFFSLGGVLLERFTDPEAPGGVALLPARFFLADPRESPDGLVAEMKRRLPPERRIPWIDQKARDQALESLSAHNLGADAEAYVRTTPCYAGTSDDEGTGP